MRQNLLASHACALKCQIYGAAGEMGGLRIPVAAHNAASEPHWLAHGKLFRSALPAYSGRGSAVAESSCTPVPVYVSSGETALAQLAGLRQSHAEQPHASSATSLGSPPPLSGTHFQLCPFELHGSVARAAKIIALSLTWSSAMRLRGMHDDLMLYVGNAPASCLQRVYRRRELRRMPTATGMAGPPQQQLPRRLWRRLAARAAAAPPMLCLTQKCRSLSQYHVFSGLSPR